MSYWNYIPGAAAAAGAADANIYCLFGFLEDAASPGFVANIDKYDPDANTWTAKTAASITACNLGTAVGIAGVVYAQGGRDSDGHKHHAGYTISSDSWGNLTQFTDENYKRAHGKMNGNYYMTGGKAYGSSARQTHATKDIHKYSVSGDSWSDTGTDASHVMAAMPSGVIDRDSTSAKWFMVNDDTSADAANNGATDKYTLATNAITVMTSLFSLRYWVGGDGRSAGFTAGGNLYMHNGWDYPETAGSMSKKVRGYSVSGNSWSVKTDTNNEKVDIGGASQDADGDTGYSIGGDQDDYSGPKVEKYSVSGNTWTNVADLTYEPQHQTGASA
jgi:hypothetical protein